MNGAPGEIRTRVSVICLLPVDPISDEVLIFSNSLILMATSASTDWATGACGAPGRGRTCTIWCSPSV